MSKNIDKIKHFRIFGQLGHGGMGAVWTGFDTERNEFVAVKTLFQEFYDDQGAVDRFAQEAEICKALNHPHIVGFHDMGYADEYHFFAQEYVQGESLRQRIARGQIPLDEAVEILEAVAKALSHAHAHNIIHRDIKPANIIINQDGVVKLIDFGIAHIEGGEIETKTGQVIGTYAYAAPEQNQGKEVEPASDLYSLGAVFYELITGEKLLPSSNLMEIVMMQMMGNYRPPEEIDPSLPPSICNLTRALLTLTPEERVRTADALLAQLKKIRDSVQDDDQNRIFGDEIRAKWILARDAYNYKKFALASSLAKFIVSRKPDFARAHFLLGKLYAIKNLPFNSTESFQKAMDLEPDNLDYQVDYALALFRLEMYSQSRRTIQVVAERDPEHLLAPGFFKHVTEAYERDKALEEEQANQANEPEPDQLPEDYLPPMMEPGKAVVHDETNPVTAPPSVAVSFLQSKARPCNDPRRAYWLSLLFPGLGDMSLGRSGAGLSRMFKALLLLAPLVFLAVSPAPTSQRVETWLLESAGDGTVDAAAVLEQAQAYASLLSIGRWGGLLCLTLLGLFLWRHWAKQCWRDTYQGNLVGEITEILDDYTVRVNIGADRVLEGQPILEVYHPASTFQIDWERLARRRPENVLKVGDVKITEIRPDDSTCDFRREPGVTALPRVGDLVRAVRV